MCNELYSPKKRELLWDRLIIESSGIQERNDISQEILDYQYFAPCEGIMVRFAGIHKQRDLFDFIWNIQAIKHLRNVFLSCFKLLLVSFFPLGPRTCVQRWLNLHQFAFLRMKGNYIQLALMATVGKLAYIDIAPNEISSVLIPFGDQLLQVIGVHRS